MAVDDGAILFFNRATLKNFPQLTRDDRIFGNNDYAAGFAIKTVTRCGWATVKG